MLRDTLGSFQLCFKRCTVIERQQATDPVMCRCMVTCRTCAVMYFSNVYFVELYIV